VCRVEILYGIEISILFELSVSDLKDPILVECDDSLKEHVEPKHISDCKVQKLKAHWFLNEVFAF
jgi:hypothetical protein